MDQFFIFNKFKAVQHWISICNQNKSCSAIIQESFNTKFFEYKPTTHAEFIYQSIIDWESYFQRIYNLGALLLILNISIYHTYFNGFLECGGLFLLGNLFVQLVTFLLLFWQFLFHFYSVFVLQLFCSTFLLSCDLFFNQINVNFMSISKRFLIYHQHDKIVIVKFIINCLKIDHSFIWLTKTHDFKWSLINLTFSKSWMIARLDGQNEILFSYMIYHYLFNEIFSILNLWRIIL